MFKRQDSARSAIATRNRHAAFVRLISALAALGAACASAPSAPASATKSAAKAEAADVPPLDPELHAVVSGSFLPPMPLAVTSFGAARDASYLYVLGGYAGTPHDYSREGQSRSLWRLALDGSSPWTELSRMSHGAQGLSLVAHEGRVCRFGGNVITNTRDEATRMESSAEASCFELATQRWQALPALPKGRSSHESALLGSTVYVAGGWTLAGGAKSGEFQSELLALDLSAKDAQWVRIPAPFSRRALGVAAASGKLAVIGGLTEETQVTPRVDLFDAVTKTWSQGPDFPSDAFGLAASSDGTYVYASARDGVVHRLKPGEASWQRVGALISPRFFHQLVVHDGSVIAVGGISGMHTSGRTRHVERLAIAPEGPSVSTLAIDYPGAAKNRQALFVHGDYLYLFGGNNSLGQHDFEPENFVAEGHRLHLHSLRWERIADYPAARQTIQSVIVGERAITVGGFGHDGDHGGDDAVSHPDVYAFDFEEQEWSTLPKLARGRTQFGLTSHGDSLWIFGGLNYDPTRPEAFDHVRSVLRAPVGGAFEPASVELPGERRAFSGATVEGRYYLLGGMQDNFAPVSECHSFDYAARTFSPFPCPERPRVSGDLIAIGQRLYMAGGMSIGEGKLGAERSIETLDLSAATPAWSKLIEALPFDTRHTRALRHGERILLVSTHNDAKRMQLAWVTP